MTKDEGSGEDNRQSGGELRALEQKAAVNDSGYSQTAASTAATTRLRHGVGTTGVASSNHSCIVTSSVPHSRDYGASGAAYDR